MTSVGRPREFDLEEALDAAMQAFWAHGYESTSMADLMLAMDLQKGSIYKAFGDKHSLFIQALRRHDLFKLPGVAETLDWTSALIQLDAVELDPEMVDDTLGVLLKYQDDIAKIRGSEAAGILDRLKSELAAAE